MASGRRWTWAELDRDVDALARGLMAAGLGKGDRVGIWAPNCAEWTLVQYATAKAGIVLVNVNPSYRTHEFAYAVNQSGLRLLLAASSFKTSDYRAMVEEVAEQCRTLERTVYVDTDDLAEAGRRGSGRAGGGARGADGDAGARTTRSTSSTRPAPPATPRAPRSATATS